MSVSQAKVIWLSGNLHERKLTLAKIKSQFASADLHILDDSFTVAYLEQVVRQESVFTESRLVIVKQMPEPTSSRQTMVNQLKKLLDDVPDECVIVFDGIPSDSEKAISGHVAKVGKLFSFPDKLESHLAVNWLVNHFRDELGKDVSESDANLLITTSGYDADVGGIGVDLLRLAALKISLYLGRRRSITTEDIQSNIFPSEEVVIWSILDALDSKDISACYAAFYKLVEKEDSIIGAVNLMYNIALPRYRLLMFLKEGMAQNKSKSTKVLLIHVGVYGAVISAMTLNPLFGAVNALIHMVVDYFTSRASSKLWADKKVHWFFVVIGLDQFLHTVCLIYTWGFFKT